MAALSRRSILVALGAAVAPAYAFTKADEAGWSPRASLPWPVQEIYAAVHGDRVVVAGGLVGRPDGLHIEDRVGLYQASTDSWSEGPRLPAPRHHPMIAATSDVLWAIGGYRRSEAGEWINSTEVWRLAPGAESWTPETALPGPQAEAVGLAYAGSVHLITGRTPGGEANAQWTDQVDIATHRVLAGGLWLDARPCPMARNSAAGAVLDDALWIAGGRTVDGGGTGRLDRYDPSADRWDTLAPIPVSPATGRQVGGGLAIAAVKGKLIAFGGEWFAPGGGGVFSETWVYHPGRDAWEAGPDMRTPRHGLAPATVDGVVYAVAGGEVVSGGRAGSVVEALVVAPTSSSSSIRR